MFWRHELFPNETIPNVIFPNRDWRNNPDFFGIIFGIIYTKLARGKGTKLGEGERD